MTSRCWLSSNSKFTVANLGEELLDEMHYESIDCKSNHTGEQQYLNGFTHR